VRGRERRREKEKEKKKIKGKEKRRKRKKGKRKCGKREREKEKEGACWRNSQRRSRARAVAFGRSATARGTREKKLRDGTVTGTDIGMVGFAAATAGLVEHAARHAGQGKEGERREKEERRRKRKEKREKEKKEKERGKKEKEGARRWNSRRRSRARAAAFGRSATARGTREKKQRDRTVTGTDVGMAGFAAATAGLVEHAAWHAGRGKEGEKMAMNFGCRTAKRREVFWEIRSSDGKRFRNVLSSTTKKF